MNDKITVGIADMKIAQGSGILITYALGSCIGLCFHDPRLKLGALLHIMLPNRSDPNDPKIYKYADSGIREMVRKLSAFGMVKSRRGQDVRGQRRQSGKYRTAEY